MSSLFYQEPSECDRPICIIFKCCHAPRTDLLDAPVEQHSVHKYKDTIGNTPMWPMCIWLCILIASVGLALGITWYGTSKHISYTNDDIYYKYVGNSAVSLSQSDNNSVPALEARRQWPTLVHPTVSWVTLLSPIMFLFVAFTVVLMFLFASDAYMLNSRTRSSFQCIVLLVMMIFVAASVATLLLGYVLDDVEESNIDRDNLLKMCLTIVDETYEQMSMGRIYDSADMAFIRDAFKTMLDDHPSANPLVLFDAAVSHNTLNVSHSERSHGLIRLLLDPVDEFLIKAGINVGKSVVTGLVQSMPVRPNSFDLNPTVEQIDLEMIKKQIVLVRYMQYQTAMKNIKTSDRFDYITIVVAVAVPLFVWLAYKLCAFMHSRIRIQCFEEWDGAAEM